jgi:ABC-type transport system involved in multi-copper enzyme maturation permease subunit
MTSRRLYRWLGGLAALGLVVLGVAVFVNTTPGSFRFTEMEENLIGLGFPLVMLGWVIGASAIGAEWQHRTVSALLTWEPRRTRVLAAKLAAACVYAAVFAVVLQAWFTLVLLPVASSRGTFAGVDSAWWGDFVATGGRVTLVAVAAAAIGFGLATIGKNTGAALGGGLAYLLVVENLVRAYQPDWSDWLLGSNMGRVVEGHASFGLAGHSTAGAAAVLAVYAAALFVLALWFFRRREMA